MNQTQPPQPPPFTTPTSNRALSSKANIRAIAVQQKVIIACLLGYVASIVLMVASPRAMPTARLLLGVFWLAVVIVAVVFVFMLAIRLFGPAGGIVLGLLTFVPFVGLIILLVVNGKATSTLKEHGVPVGLLGAKMSHVPHGAADRRRPQDTHTDDST